MLHPTQELEPPANPARFRWSETFAIADLPGKLAFYRGLRDRAGGGFARFYEPTVAALEAVGRELANAGLRVA